MRAWRLPQSMPGGDMMPFMSGRYRTATMDALFHGVGGFERARAWIEASDENYAEFFKLWAKGAIRPTAIEHQGAQSLEDMIAKLDAGEHAKVVEGEVIE